MKYCLSEFFFFCNLYFNHDAADLLKTLTLLMNHHQTQSVTATQFHHWWSICMLDLCWALIRSLTARDKLLRPWILWHDDKRGTLVPTVPLLCTDWFTLFGHAGNKTDGSLTAFWANIICSAVTAVMKWAAMISDSLPKSVSLIELHPTSRCRALYSEVTPDSVEYFQKDQPTV